VQQTLIMGSNDPDIFAACAYLPDANASRAVDYLRGALPQWGLPEMYLDDMLGAYNVSTCTAGPGDGPDRQCCHVVENMQLDYMMKWCGGNLF
jgi:hypothetical protein